MSRRRLKVVPPDPAPYRVWLWEGLVDDERQEVSAHASAEEALAAARAIVDRALVQAWARGAFDDAKEVFEGWLPEGARASVIGPPGCPEFDPDAYAAERVQAVAVEPPDDRHPREQDGRSPREDDPALAPLRLPALEEEGTVADFVQVYGKTVYSLCWDNGMVGCSGVDVVQKCCGLYWSNDWGAGFQGPYATLEEALRNVPTNVSAATQSVSCSELSTEELVALLSPDAGEEDLDLTVVINGEDYVVRAGSSELVPAPERGHVIGVRNARRLRYHRP